MESAFARNSHRNWRNQLFRSQQSQAATPGAAAQLQLLQQQQQQQYLAAAQQQQAAAAAFTQQGPYVLNAQQEPYLITTGVPAQYYGVAPWVYPAPPASLAALQQGASNGARRPLTPNGTNEAQQQVQVLLYCNCLLKSRPYRKLLSEVESTFNYAIASSVFC
ncbi:hypothetical protein HUJ05_005809 [Dendroctonus ponderosae]|nr:hypothetical protein HUJ05_005806 [Dendroctonus ponderosae]KAH0999304.1 hypothetical protein HUJ05_005809 [Dendroctonus ponderosae]